MRWRGNDNLLGSGGRNGFHFACEQGELVIANFLIQGAGAEINGRTDRGRLPIHLATHQDRGERTRTLLDLLVLRGANIQDVDFEGRTPLNEAAHCGNITAIPWLLQKGASLKARDKQGRTPLHVAAAGAVTCLLDQGADPSVLNQAEERPLFEAILKGKSEIAKIFFVAYGSRKRALRSTWDASNRMPFETLMLDHYKLTAAADHHFLSKQTNERK
jgi:Ankyrin repeats (3 copies)/Ankyrin repeat